MGETNYSISDTTEHTSNVRRWDLGAVLAAVIACIALGSVAWLEKAAWDRVSYAEKTFKKAHSEEFSSGVRFQESLARLQLELLLFQVSGAEENEQTYQSHARELSGQIASAKAIAENYAQQELLGEIEIELKSFLRKAESFVPQRAIRRDTVSSLSRELEAQVEPLSSKITRLIEGQNAARNHLATKSAHAFAFAHRALKHSMFALVVLLFSLGLLGYRAIVVPLKSRLDETAAASQRHEKLASLGVLATGVAHEIRNPLTAIKLRLFSLKKTLGAGLSENTDFQTIRAEIDRLERLTKSFLEFAKPAEPKCEKISGAELLESVRGLLEPEFARNKIDLKVKASDGVEFRGDKQQLQQVLINLAQNARDSMPTGGTIKLRVHDGAASFRNGSKPAVMLDVIDTGTGIEPEVQKRLFDPFFSTKEGGTGLGLAIAARIIEQHGGLLQFSTRRNEGSTFTIVLPKENGNAAG